MFSRAATIGVVLVPALFLVGCTGPTQTPPPAPARPAAIAGSSDPAAKKSARPELVQVKPRPALFTDKGPAVSSNDPRLAAFESYLKPMCDKIQSRWDKELLYKQYPGAGKSTCVTFILKSSGEVSQVKSVKSDAGRIGEEAAVDAITYSAPYPRWTAAMRAVLGDKQEITITFNYE